MRLLRVLHFRLVRARGGRNRLVAVQRSCLSSRRGDRLRGQRDRVGAHVGDVTVLIEALRNAHRVTRAESQFAASFLLQGRCREWRGGPACVWLRLDCRDDWGCEFQGCCERRGRLFVKDGCAAREFSVVVEVASLGKFVVAQFCHASGEVVTGLCADGRRHIPV